MGLRLLLGIALIAALFATGALDASALAAVVRRPILAVAAIVVLFLTLPVAALRWHLLLRAQRIALPRRTLLRLVLGTTFYGTLLPGVVGGDLLRTALTVRAAREHKAAALLSIVLDRALGLAGLLLVAIGLALAHPSALSRLIGAVALAVCGALLALTLAAHRIAPLARGRGRIATMTREMASALRLWRAAPAAVVTGLVLSMVIAGLDLAGLLLVARATGLAQLTGIEQALAGTLALLANSLPLTPGGLGVGEAAYANAAMLLDGAANGAPHASVFLAYRCATILSTVPGALVKLAT